MTDEPIRNWRQRGIDNLHKMMAEQGFIRGRHEDFPDRVMTSYEMSGADLPPDGKAPHQRCGLCLREAHKQRRVFAHRVIPHAKERGIDDEPLCGVCASLVNDQSEVLINRWFALPRDNRRQHLAIHYGLDPATRDSHEFAITFRGLLELEGSDSLVATSDTMTVGRIHYVGVPRTYWDWSRERGER